MAKRKLNTDLIVRLSIWFFSTVVLAAGVFWALTYAWGGTTLPDGYQSRTGTIKLNISPRGAFSAYLDGEPRPVSNDEIIDNILPGKYTLRIQKDGFTSWEQDIRVNAGLITDVSTQLFPSNLELTQLTKSNLDYISYSQDGRFAYYLINTSLNSEEVGLWRYSLEESILPLIDQAPIKLSNSNRILRDASTASEIDIWPAPNNNSLLLKLEDEYYVISGNNFTTQLSTSLLGISYPIEQISWIGSNNLLIESTDMLVDYEVNSQTSRIIHFEGNSEIKYASNNDGLILLRNEELFSYSSGLLSEVSLDEFSTLSKEVFTNIILSAADLNTFLAISEENEIFYIDLNNEKHLNLGKGEILSYSPNLSTVFLNRDTQTESVSIKYSLSRERLLTNKYLLPADISINWKNLVWAPNNNYFVYSETKQGNNSIFSADKAGENIIKLLDLERIPADVEYTITSDNSSLVLNLLDNTTDATLPQRMNLYKVEFE